MITPSAAPRRRPVPKEESFDICAFENVNDSGRIPTAKEVMPSNPERVQRTYNEDMVLVGV